MIQREAKRIGAKIILSDEWLARMNDSRDYLRHHLRHLQVNMGESLVDTIWRAGGVATVQLGMHEQRHFDMCSRDLTLTADVNPAEYIHSKLVVPHFVTHHELFPLDWYCHHCGRLNDGMVNVRQCGGCGSSKPREYF